MLPRPSTERASWAPPSAHLAPAPLLLAFLVVFLALLGAVSLVPSRAVASPATTVTRGPTDRPRIALTFDDNFYPSRALAAIRVLRQFDVKATMFVTGQYVTAYPEISQAIVDGGFEVGDHSMTHPFLSRLSWSGMLAEIGGGTRRFVEQTGARTAPLMRPPYGATSTLVAEAAGSQGFHYVVLWDVDTSDWRGYSAATIRDRVLQNAHNGAIVLMHLAAPNTADALPGIIAGLRARGYELVTVSDLLKSGRRYADVDEGSSVGQAVLRMNDLGYMAGYSQSYFGPLDMITRAQFAKVSVLVTGRHTPEVEWSSSPTFADVPPRWDTNGNPISYPFDYVEEAAAAGVMAGHPEGEVAVFEPDRALSRVQLAQILARMAREIKGYPHAPASQDGGSPPTTPRSRFDDIPDYAVADVELVASLGLMNGYGGRRFDPWETAQRGHVAVVMTRFIDLPPYQPPAESPTPSTLPPGEPAQPATDQPAGPEVERPAGPAEETTTTPAVPPPPANPSADPPASAAPDGVSDPADAPAEPAPADP